MGNTSILPISAMDAKRASVLKDMKTILCITTKNAVRHIVEGTLKTWILMTLIGLVIYHIIFYGAIAPV
jgi:hypothetical protein